MAKNRAVLGVSLQQKCVFYSFVCTALLSPYNEHLRLTRIQKSVLERNNIEINVKPQFGSYEHKSVRLGSEI